jgi:hypothetical protein
MLAAVVMMTASACVGFVAGRMSAWVIPVEDAHAVPTATGSIDAAPATATASAIDRHEATAKSPSAVTKVGERLKRLLEKSSAAASQPRAAAEPASTAAAVAPAAPPVAPAAKPAPAAIVEAQQPPPAAQPVQPRNSEAATRGVTLLNPGQGDARRGDAQPTLVAAAPAGDIDPVRQQAALEECERRFTSFRRTDGTYQPHGGGPRTLCPLLREGPSLPSRTSKSGNGAKGWSFPWW